MFPPTKVNVFNPTGPKKEGPSFQSSKPVCPFGKDGVLNPDGTCSLRGIGFNAVKA